MYHPNLGRFIQPDPIGFEAGDPNFYRTEGNNPANRVDPSGLEEELGGTKYELPRGLNPFRYLFDPSSKVQCLKDVPYWRKQDLPLLPKELRKCTFGTAAGWCGVVPNGWAVGPDGCGSCVGVVLIPPKAGMKTFVLHFAAPQHIPNCFQQVGFLEKRAVMVDKEFAPGKVIFHFDEVQKGYKAIICGAEWSDRKQDDKERLYTLQDVVSWLKVHEVPITAYIPAPGFCVDNNGKVYWITPDSSPVDKYEK